MKAVLIESHDLAPEVKHFVFETPGEFSFQPGQFVSLSAALGGKKITRAYSICSTPDGRRFELCLNRVQGGLFSPHLFDLRPGDEVEVKGPLGTFVLREPPADSVLVATGTGIAPIRGILRQAVPAHPGVRFTLLFGTRFEATLLYRSEFEQMQRERENFRYWPTLSRGALEWTGRRGYVQAHLAEAVEARRDIDIYVCGQRAMVDAVRTQAKEMGFDRKRIIHEKYD